MRKTSENRNYENVNKRRYAGTGEYDIPIIKPEQFDGCQFIGFNYASSCKEKREEKGIHFYLDDYQFIRLWNMIDRYLPMLQTFKYVMTPDFSTYADFPLALQIYNHYRKHWIGAYLQEKGVRVIPTISWSDEKSYKWCFDGEPTHGVVSVSAVGTQMNKQAKKLFIEGYQEMMHRLHPETIIFYGPVPEECTGNIVRIKSFQEKFGEVDCNGR
ncbi:MAG: DUF4417 domain-containing protein [Lachnospiraceae bacterium]|nr:DUF4417 domain-containing protein [Lachnospiraceae bacterium]